jgi:hypothetical protein
VEVAVTDKPIRTFFLWTPTAIYDLWLVGPSVPLQLSLEPILVRETSVNSPRAQAANHLATEGNYNSCILQKSMLLLHTSMNAYVR